MPSPELLGRYQKAVLWAASGTDNYGEAQVNAAIEITVRWDASRRDGVDAETKTVGGAITVTVDRDVAIGSILWLGNLVDVPATKSDLYQVVSFSKKPDIKGRKFYRTVELIRYSNELPALN